MAKDGNEKIRPAPDELVPLLTAAALALDEVYQGAAGVDRKIALNVMAHVLCDLSPVFIRDRGRVRVVSSSELRGGVFTDGSESLSIVDGRPPLERIAIRAGDLRKVIQSLIDSGITFAALHVPPGRR